MDRNTAVAVLNAIILYPLDAIKTKQIVSLDPLPFNEAARRVWRANRLQGIYSGVVPYLLSTMIRSILKNRIRIKVIRYFYPSTDSEEENKSDDSHFPSLTITPKNAFLVETLASGLSGAVVTAFIHPLDVVKVALQITNEAEMDKFVNAWDAFESILRGDGIFGIYRGFVPNILGSFLFSSALWAFYSCTKRYLFILKGTNRHSAVQQEHKQISIQQSKSAGVPLAISLFMAAVLASFLETPFDAVKTRFISGMLLAGTHYYNGHLRTTVMSMLHSPFSEFFRGVVPKCLQAGLAGALSVLTTWIILHLSDNNKQQKKRA
jgi:hypothetical protein